MASLPNRKSVRLNGYDYSQPGGYFVTIVTINRNCIFGSISDDKLLLNPIGQMVGDEWQRLEKRFPQIRLGAWIVMPNHLHGVIEIIDLQQKQPSPGEIIHIEQFGAPTAGSLATIIRSFKSSVTQQYQRITSNHSSHLWQRGFYDHVIRNEKDLENIERYILFNPDQWAADENHNLAR